jgi:hypothetical protein
MKIPVFKTVPLELPFTKAPTKLLGEEEER